MNLILLVVVLILALPVLAVVGFFLMIISRGGSGKRDGIQAEETRLIQELHQGLLRMEERIDALETILFDAEQKEDRK